MENISIKKTLVSAFGFYFLMVTAVAWASPVPDTGQTKCYNATVEVPCPSPGHLFYGQDANYTIIPPSYTKLGSSGNPLADSAKSWVMVRDNVSGLTWEMKTNMDGIKDYSDPHDADNTYTWYDSNPATNGGNSGPLCSDTDTEDFIKALNYAHYGGFSDWRLPTVNELKSIVNYSIPFPGPTVDVRYFPNTAASWYWSSTTNAYNNYYAWNVDFYTGYGYNEHKDYDGYVRAVRSGQSGALVVSPVSQAVAKDAGTTTFSVSNTGTQTMPLTAAVTSGGTWLSIASGTSDSNSGTITCSFTENTSSSARTATIRVTAAGATASSQEVTITQTPTLSACAATLNVNLLLHVPYLSYNNGTMMLSTDFVYSFNPTFPNLIPFKLSSYAIINNPSFSCAASTLSSDLKLHIPDVLLPDGNTHLWVDLVFSSALSTSGNAYFVVSNYGAISN